MSKIIVIDGTDGSGKKTQTEVLINRLNLEGKKTYNTSFPNYESPSSASVKMYLNGEISENSNDISAKAASVFFAQDRYITFYNSIKKYYEQLDYLILLDRYSSSNIIHQGAKIIIQNENENEEIIKQRLKEFIFWLDNFEHVDLGIPRADITIYLHVPAEYTLKLMENRNNEITGESKKDIHEADINHLKNAEKAGLMAAEILGWNVIECMSNDKMRTIENIHEEIYLKLKNKII